MVKSQKLDGYIETSAMTESDQVSKVFEEAARLALGKEPQFMPEETEPGCFPFLECKFFNWMCNFIKVGIMGPTI